MSDDFPPRVGDRVCGRYELMAPLRAAGPAHAFMAVDHRSGREVELTVFAPTAIQADDWGAFARVITAAATAKIPGLVLPRGVTRSVPSPPSCAAELQSARGFDRWIAQGPTPWPRALALCERVAEIVERAHAASGAAHRALTPSRCVVTAREDVKVLDYGFAELAAVRADDSPYRAPEQQRGVGDPRSDVYAIGVMLFELITGQRAWGGPLPRAGATVELPPAVDALIERATAADPHRRHADPATLRAALRALIDAEAGREAATGSPAPVGVADAPRVHGGEDMLLGPASDAAAGATAEPPTPGVAAPVFVPTPPAVAPVPGSLPPLLSAEEKTDMLGRAAPVGAPPLLSAGEKTDILAPAALGAPRLSAAEKTDIVARDALVASARRTGAQPTVPGAALARRTGAQPTVPDVAAMRRTGAQPVVAGRRTGPQAVVAGRRTGPQPVVAGRRTGAQSTVSPAAVRTTGAQPVVPLGDRTEIAPRPTARSPIATSSHRIVKTATSALRSVSLAADEPAPSGDSTVVARPPAAPETLVLPDEARPDFRIFAGQVVAKPGPARGGETQLLTVHGQHEPPALGERARPATTLPSQSGETVVLQAPPVPRDSSPAPAAAGWPLRKTLIVVNVALALVVLLGWIATVVS